MPSRCAGAEVSIMIRWGSSSGAGEPFEAPRANPEITRRLSLTLPAVPSEFRAGDETWLLAVLANVGDATVRFSYPGTGAALIWNESATAVVGGDLGWSAMMPRYAGLAPGDELRLRVKVITSAVSSAGPPNMPLRPLPPGTYRLQACCYLWNVSANAEAWNGWVLSPFYRVSIGGPRHQ